MMRIAECINSEKISSSYNLKFSSDHESVQQPERRISKMTLGVMGLKKLFCLTCIIAEKIFYLSFYCSTCVVHQVIYN